MTGKATPRGKECVIEDDTSSIGEVGEVGGPPKCTGCDASEGKAFLEGEDIIEAGGILDVSTLVDALIHISVLEGMPSLATKAIRAVALLLDQQKLDKTGDAIIESIENKVDTLVEVVTKKAAASIEVMVASAAAEIKTASTAMAESATQMTVTTSSYRDALWNSLPNPATGATTLDVRIRAWEGIKSRQVLIDVQAPGQTLLSGSTNASLTEAANKAIQDMDGASDHCFTSARRLNNGGILLELDSEAAAGWLGDTAMKAAFISRYAPEATVKEQAFPLVVQFVPLHFKPERDTEIGSLEKDNGLPAGSILRAKWIKPAYRRSPDQTCGHLILVASKPETANKILTDGLIICQKRVYAEKCKKEPTWCLKCHR